ncbi:MAG: hypothetical protein RLY61_300 [Candidatus Parcubacteria bacterium]|jgi:hypothetical protein
MPTNLGLRLDLDIYPTSNEATRYVAEVGGFDKFPDPTVKAEDKAATSSAPHSPQTPPVEKADQN